MKSHNFAGKIFSVWQSSYKQLQTCFHMFRYKQGEHTINVAWLVLKMLVSFHF